VGKDSLAAQLAPNSVGKDFELDPKKEYAEVSDSLKPSDGENLELPATVYCKTC
jgi:hypothetical protein